MKRTPFTFHRPDPAGLQSLEWEVCEAHCGWRLKQKSTQRVMLAGHMAHRVRLSWEATGTRQVNRAKKLVVPFNLTRARVSETEKPGKYFAQLPYTLMGSMDFAESDDRWWQLAEAFAKANISYEVSKRSVVRRKPDVKTEWYITTPWTTMNSAGDEAGQRVDFKKACEECGAGARIVAPLIIKIARPSARGWNGSCPLALLVISAKLAAALAKARLTGFVAEPVETGRPRKIDPRYRWLRITSTLPTAHASSSIDRSEVCKHCGVSGHGDYANNPATLRYGTMPRNAKDFNLTHEQFGTTVGPYTPNRPRGGLQKIILSHRTREVLIKAGVQRHLFTPLERASSR